MGTREKPSVSAVLQRTLHRIHGITARSSSTAVCLDGASRTDAGVHALGAVALYKGVVNFACACEHVERFKVWSCLLV